MSVKNAEEMLPFLLMQPAEFVKVNNNNSQFLQGQDFLGTVSELAVSADTNRPIEVSFNS